MSKLVLACAGALALTACAAPPTPSPSGLHPLGLVELSVHGLGTQALGSSVRVLSPIRSQSLQYQAKGLQFDPLNLTVFNVGTRAAGGQRYVTASYRVRNADSDGTPSPRARSNVTLLAVAAGDTAAGTAFRAVTTFGNTAVSDSVIRSILPTHAMHFDPLSAAAVLDPGGEDLQVFTESEVAPGSLRSATGGSLSYADLGVRTIFPYGFTVHTVGGSRTLPANPATGQFDGRVAFSVKLPLQPDDAAQTPPQGTGRDPWAFRIVLLVVEDTDTRVTQSVEEQSNNALVTQRAASLNATLVNVLPGSTYASGTAPKVPSRCIGMVRTAGLAGDADAAYLVKGVCP